MSINYDNNCLFLYYHLHQRLTEPLLVERIVRLLVPESCPVPYFFADADDIPDDILELYGLTRPAPYFGSPWDDGPPDPVGDAPGGA